MAIRHVPIGGLSQESEASHEITRQTPDVLPKVAQGEKCNLPNLLRRGLAANSNRNNNTFPYRKSLITSPHSPDVLADIPQNEALPQTKPQRTTRFHLTKVSQDPRTLPSDYCDAPDRAIAPPMDDPSGSKVPGDVRAAPIKLRQGGGTGNSRFGTWRRRFDPTRTRTGDGAPRLIQRVLIARAFGRLFMRID